MKLLFSVLIRNMHGKPWMSSGRRGKEEVTLWALSLTSIMETGSAGVSLGSSLTNYRVFFKISKCLYCMYRTNLYVILTLKTNQLLKYFYSA